MVVLKESERRKRKKWEGTVVGEGEEKEGGEREMRLGRVSDFLFLNVGLTF